MKYRILLLSILVLGIVLFPIFDNLIGLNSRIYSIIEYDVRAPDKDEIIIGVETLNYTAYLNNRGWDHDIYKSYIDASLVELLRNTIEDVTRFHWELWYEHYLRYYFAARNRSSLFLTYNNNTIFSVKDQSNNTLLSIDNYSWNRIAWYLNFTHLSYVYNNSSTILLNNAIFIHMSLDYGYYCGSLCGLWHSIEQYLVLSSNLDVLVIFIESFGPVVS